MFLHFFIVYADDTSLILYDKLKKTVSDNCTSAITELTDWFSANLAAELEMSVRQIKTWT